MASVELPLAEQSTPRQTASHHRRPLPSSYLRLYSLPLLVGLLLLASNSLLQCAASQEASSSGSGINRHLTGSLTCRLFDRASASMKMAVDANGRPDGQSNGYIKSEPKSRSGVNRSVPRKRGFIAWSTSQIIR